MDESSDYTVGTLLALVILCGFCGNTLVAYSIFTEKRLLKSNYYFLVLNLAICDALHILSALRVNLKNVLRTWPLRETAACKIWMYLEMLLCHCGVILMTMICIFRYRAVLQPLKPRFSQRKLTLIPLVIFVTISIYLIPYILTFEYNSLAGCIQKWSNNTLKLMYTLLSVNLHFIIPVATMSVLYYKICKALVSEANKMNSMLQTETASQMQQSQFGTQVHFQKIRHHRNTRTFLISAVSLGIFTITFVPFDTWWFMNANGFGHLTIEYAGWFYLLYITGSSAVNPFIYGVLDKKLIEGLKRARKRRR